MDNMQSSSAEPAAPTTAEPTSQNPAADKNQNSFTIPETYQSKPWVEKIKTPDDLWKTLDNAQSLLGKRSAFIPSNDAPEEEWGKFFDALRPESPDKYQFSQVDGLPEGADLSELEGKARTMMHQAGLSPKQADKLWREYVGDAVKQSAAIKETKEKAEAEFQGMAKEYFGEDYGAALNKAVSFASELLPESLKKAFADDSIPSSTLIAVAAFADAAQKRIESVMREYGAEGGLPGNGSAAPSIGKDAALSEVSKLRLSVEARDPTHPKHKEANARIAELNGYLKKILS